MIVRTLDTWKDAHECAIEIATLLERGEFKRATEYARDFERAFATFAAEQEAELEEALENSKWQ